MSKSKSIEQLMKEYHVKATAASELEAEIKGRVLKIAQSQEFNGVRARYMKGKSKVDYESIATKMEASKASIKRHTTPKVDWKSVVGEIKETPKEVIKKFTTTGDPTVSLKIVE